MVNGRSKHYIGGFKCQEEAAKVYDRAAIQLKGMKVSERVSESGLHQLQLHEEGSARDNARRGSFRSLWPREDWFHVLIIVHQIKQFLFNSNSSQSSSWECSIYCLGFLHLGISYLQWRTFNYLIILPWCSEFPSNFDPVCWLSFLNGNQSWSPSESASFLWVRWIEHSKSASSMSSTRKTHEMLV